MATFAPVIKNGEEAGKSATTQGVNAGLYPRVYEIVAQVPRGRVATYGQIARHLGLPHGARVVGWAMRHCPQGVPWHRVVNAQGGLSKGEHVQWIALQRSLLEEEGVVFNPTGCIDLRLYGWDGI